MPDDLRPVPVARPLSEAITLSGARLVTGDPDLPVTGVTHDSRAVRPGDVYAALPGFTTHGARFATDAVAAGAVAVLTDPSGSDAAIASGAAVLVAPEPRAVLGEIAAWAYGRPGDELLLIGVTGTNGKTTTTYLVEAGLRAAGRTTGLIGTVGTRIADTVVPTVRTTPEATDLHALLGVMRERGVDAVAMEVSSHALVLGRVDGLVFDLAVFTNLTQDHLDFHVTMTAYFEAKASLFTPHRARAGLVCVDDAWGAKLALRQRIPTTTYAIAASGTDVDWVATDVRSGATGSAFVARGPEGDVTVAVNLPGTYNVANALAAVVAVAGTGVALEVAAAGVAACAGVPGRMQRVAAGQPFAALVDYAHTPDAVAGALAAVRPVTPGRLIVVLGCGGDRDHDKRAPMGRIAAERADVVIVTDDNPRSEDPATIRASVLAGAREGAGTATSEVIEVGDRRAAISAAVRMAADGDTVMVLGKGHEQGQEVAGVVHPFDDRVVLDTLIRAESGRSGT